jgi:hypothetical protein
LDAWSGFHGRPSSKADLTRADLTRADLTRADFTDADLTDAELGGAIWPHIAPVPDGWRRNDDGRLRETDH